MSVTNKSEANKSATIKVLNVEDDDDDAELLAFTLGRSA